MVGIISLYAEAILDNVCRLNQQTISSLGVCASNGEIGILTTTAPIQKDGNSSKLQASHAFIARRDVVLTQPLWDYFRSSVQRELRAAYGIQDEVDEAHLTSFIREHPDRKECVVSLYGQQKDVQVIYLPHSLSIDVFVTRKSYHITFGFLDSVKTNRYDNGYLFADGHIHRVLSPQRIGNDGGLAILARRFGPVRAASVLSLSDAKQLSLAQNWGRCLDLNHQTDFAVRELYVVGDDGELLDHTVFNHIALWNNDEEIKRFIEVTKSALASPSNMDLRIAYHDMMHEYTEHRPIDKPLSPDDYGCTRPERPGT